HAGGVGLGEEQSDGGDVALRGVGVGGAQQALAADGAEDLAQQRVEGALAAAVGGDGDPGPGAVGAAGARPLAFEGGREQFVDGDAVPQGRGGGEPAAGAGLAGVPGEPAARGGAADESRSQDEADGGGHDLGPGAPSEEP